MIYMKGLEILEFIKHNENWQEQLAEKPYCVNVKWDGNYFLLTYNQIKSDFKNKVVQQCRGSVFKYENGEYTCVCMPFYKFGNYSESYSKDFDWSGAYVTEKIDGSLVNLWYDNGEWHWSTRGCVDARKAYTNREQTDSIYDRINSIVSGNYSFLDKLDKSNIYMFEIVYPNMRTIVKHDNQCLNLIGIRNMNTLQEQDINLIYELYAEVFEQLGCFGVPCIYKLNSLNDCIDFLKSVNQNNEGFVAVDKEFRRIKIKSPAYLSALSITRGNKVDDEAVISMIRGGVIDDFLAYNDNRPEIIEKIEKLIEKYNKLLDLMKSEYESTKDSFNLERKDFSKIIKPKVDIVKAYLFKCYSGEDMSVDEYLDSISNRTIVQSIKKM